MQIDFSGRHTRAEYFRAVWIAYRPAMRIIANRLILATSAGLLYIAYQINLAPERMLSWLDPSRLIWHLAAALVLLVVVAEPFVAPWYVAIRLWRDPAARTDWQGRIGPTGITFNVSGRSIRWDAFIQAISQSDILVLKTGTSGFLALPKRFFQGDADWRQACQLASSRVKPAPHSRRLPWRQG
jgi:hypothetical protein